MVLEVVLGLAAYEVLQKVHVFVEETAAVEKENALGECSRRNEQLEDDDETSGEQFGEADDEEDEGQWSRIAVLHGCSALGA